MKNGERRRNLISILLLLVSCATFAHTYIPTNLNTSPFDEYVFIDYLAKSPDQFGIKIGEETGPFARNQIACKGVWPGAHTWGEGCDAVTRNNDEAYPWSGLSSAYLYTPTYFSVTRAFSAPLTFFGIPLVDAARYVDMFWIFLGLVVLFFVSQRIGISRKVALGVLLLLLATPATYWAGTYVTPDSMAYLVSGSAMYLYLKVRSGEMSPKVLILFGVAAVAIKPIFILIPMFLFLASLIQVIENVDKDRVDNSIRAKITEVLPYALGVVAAGLTTIIWGLYLAATAIGPKMSQGDLIATSKSQFVMDAFTFLGSSSRYGLPVGEAFRISGSMTDLLLIVGLSAAALSVVRFRGFSLYQSALLTSLFAGPIVTLLWQISNGFPGVTIPLGTRYGIILMGTWAIATAVVMEVFKPLRSLAIYLGAAIFAIVILFPDRDLHGSPMNPGMLVFLIPITLTFVLAVVTLKNDVNTQALYGKEAKHF